MIILYFVFLVMSFYFSFKNPTIFIILFILFVTKFLGFFNPAQILISGLGIAYFLFNIMTFFSALIGLFKSTITKKEFTVLFIVLSFYLYGLFLPFMLDYSSFLQAIMASQSMMFYSLIFLKYH